MSIADADVAIGLLELVVEGFNFALDEAGVNGDSSKFKISGGGL
jgi:hypothetical protein